VTIVDCQLTFYCEWYLSIVILLRVVLIDCYFIASGTYRLLFYCEWYLWIVILHLIVGDAESYVIFS